MSGSELNQMPALRSRDDLLSFVAHGHRVKYLFFWGHTATKPNVVSKECLSQWYESEFRVDGIVYPSAEHFMMAEKARLFNDQGALERILAVGHPAEAKKIGRAVKDYQEAAWKQHRFDIVVRGNVAKFSQNAALKEFLCASGDRILVEASPLDPIWGIGLDQNDPRAENPAHWRGLNLLGFALMEVRAGFFSAA